MLCLECLGQRLKSKSFVTCQNTVPTDSADSLSAEGCLSEHCRLLAGYQGEQSPAVTGPTPEELGHYIYDSVLNTEKVLDSLAVKHTTTKERQWLSRK